MATKTIIMTKKIAVIDDNADQRTTVITNLELGLQDLGSDLEIIGIEPFHEPNDYFNFIQSNDVCLIILDEKLHDQPNSNGLPVKYKGSELIGFLREKLKELPIFAMTVIPTDSELLAKYSQYEGIINRQDFYDYTEKYVPKFWRAAKNYLEENISELDEFNQLTKLVAGGDSDPEKIKKLQALQVRLEIPFSGFDSRKDWIDEYQKQLDALETLNTKIKSKLDPNNELEIN